MSSHLQTKCFRFVGKGIKIKRELLNTYEKYIGEIPKLKIQLAPKNSL